VSSGKAIALPDATEHNMLAMIAAILLVAWLLGFAVFHVTTFAIHVLLIVAVVALVMHFVRGPRTN
jgi:hypothetical protein